MKRPGQLTARSLISLGAFVAGLAFGIMAGYVAGAAGAIPPSTFAERFGKASDWLMVLLTLGAFIMLWLTLRATREAVARAAEANTTASQAVEDQREIGQAQARGYITLSDGDVFVTTPDWYRLGLTLTNGGATPLQYVMLHVSVLGWQPVKDRDGPWDWLEIGKASKPVGIVSPGSPVRRHVNVTVPGVYDDPTRAGRISVTVGSYDIFRAEQDTIYLFETASWAYMPDHSRRSTPEVLESRFETRARPRD